MPDDFILNLLLGALFATILFAPVGVYLFLDFKHRGRKNDIKSIPSFFDLNEFVQESNLTAYAKLYAVGLSAFLWITFVFLCLSKPANDQVNSMLALILGSSDNKVAQKLAEMMSLPANHFPAPISLFIIVAIIIIVFFSYFKWIIATTRSAVQQAVGFDNTCEHVIRQAASDVEAANTANAGNAGNTVFANGALPREFGPNATKFDELQFQILGEAVRDAPDIGLIASFK
jgi:hypothetical protein